MSCLLVQRTKDGLKVKADSSILSIKRCQGGQTLLENCGFIVVSCGCIPL